MSEIVAGDVVLLKSGGPHMTVNNVNDDDVECCRMTKGRPAYSTFKVWLLKKSKSQPDDDGD